MGENERRTSKGKRSRTCAVQKAEPSTVEWKWGCGNPKWYHYVTPGKGDSVNRSSGRQTS